LAAVLSVGTGDAWWRARCSCDGITSLSTTTFNVSRDTSSRRVQARTIARSAKMILLEAAGDLYDPWRGITYLRVNGIRGTSFHLVVSN